MKKSLKKKSLRSKIIKGLVAGAITASLAGLTYLHREKQAMQLQEHKIESKIEAIEKIAKEENSIEIRAKLQVFNKELSKVKKKIEEDNEDEAKIKELNEQFELCQEQLSEGLDFLDELTAELSSMNQRWINYPEGKILTEEELSQLNSDLNKLPLLGVIEKSVSANI